MARALYNGGDIFLLDGLFDSFDEKEKKTFFTRVILRELSTKTVIFTNSERTLARLSDKIVVMKDGVIQEEGGIDYFDSQNNSLFDNIINTDNVVQTKTTKFSK